MFSRMLLASLAFFVLNLFLISPGQALPLVDFEFGGRYWAPAPSGDLSYEGDNLDLEKNLDFEREGAPHVYARAEFAMFMLDAHYTRLDYSGQGKNITKRTRFGDIDLDDYTDISTEASMDMLHLGALFNLPLPMLELGIGAGVHYIDGQAEIKANGLKEKGSASAPLPVAKARLHFSPPGLDLDLGLAGEGLAYSGHSFLDLRGTIGYTLQDLFIGDLRLEGGYRHISVDYDEEDLMLDTSFSGPFAGLSLNF